MSVRERGGPVLDIHVERPRECHVRGVQERSAITANVVVLPVFWKPQTSQVSFDVLAFFAKDLGAGEPRIAGSVLIDGHCREAQGDNCRCDGLQVVLPVHSESVTGI